MDGQTDRQAYGQTDVCTGRQMDKWTEGQTYRQAYGQTDSYIDRIDLIEIVLENEKSL